MNTSLRFMSSIVLFFALLGIVFDFAQINYLKRAMKDSLDLSTKAAAMQLNEDPAKIGQGIFEIDVSKAKAVNQEVFTENLNSKFNQCVVATDIINTHVPTSYAAPNGKQYNIDSPTIFSSVKYYYKGMFVHWDLNVQLLSGSVLKNKNDLKN